MKSPCAFCGGEAAENHHPTGRDGRGRYLDPRLTLPSCHNDHCLADDDWHTQGIHHSDPHLTFLELLELSLRRLGACFGRLGQAENALPLFAALAQWSIDKADHLRRTIRALDRDNPAWRAIREVRND